LFIELYAQDGCRMQSEQVLEVLNLKNLWSIQ